MGSGLVLNIFDNYNHCWLKISCYYNVVNTSDIGEYIFDNTNCMIQVLIRFCINFYPTKCKSENRRKKN